MEKQEYKHLLKILSIVFITVFVVVGIASNVYVVMEFEKGNNPITMLSGYQIFSLLLGIVVYIPMIIIIHRYACLADIKKAIWISRAVLCYLVFFEAIMLVVTIAETWKQFLF